MGDVTEEQKAKVFEAVRRRGGYIADITDAGPIAQETGVGNVMKVLYALCKDKDKKLIHLRSASCSEVDYFSIPNLPDKTSNKQC